MINILVIGISSLHLGVVQAITRSVSRGDVTIVESKEPAVKPLKEAVHEITLRRKDFTPDIDKYIPEDFFRGNSHPFYRGLKKYKKY